MIGHHSSGGIIIDNRRQRHHLLPPLSPPSVTAAPVIVVDAGEASSSSTAFNAPADASASGESSNGPGYTNTGVSISSIRSLGDLPRADFEICPLQSLFSLMHIGWMQSFTVQVLICPLYLPLSCVVVPLQLIITRHAGAQA